MKISIRKIFDLMFIQKTNVILHNKFTDFLIQTLQNVLYFPPFEWQSDSFTFLYCDVNQNVQRLVPVCFF